MKTKIIVMIIMLIIATAGIAGCIKPEQSGEMTDPLKEHISTTELTAVEGSSEENTIESEDRIVTEPPSTETIPPTIGTPTTEPTETIPPTTGTPTIEPTETIPPATEAPMTESTFDSGTEMDDDEF